MTISKKILLFVPKLLILLSVVALLGAVLVMDYCEKLHNKLREGKDKCRY